MTETLKKVGNYKFIKKIGSGATSDVYEGRKEGELERFAIKMIKVKAMSKQQREAIEKEVLIIKNIEHPNIVKLHETLATANHYYLIFEFCEKGDLQKYLKANLGTLLSLESVRKIVKCIGQAVMHIHSKGIAHRDLKLANILLKKDLTIKLADFGFAKEQSSTEEVMMKTYCGTPITMAPEILKGKPYDKKCDLWSLGVILFQLIYGKLPFPINQGYLTFIQKVTNQDVELPQTPKIPESLRQLIVGCLQKQQSNRFDIEQFMGNKWMQEAVVEVMKEEKHETVNDILKKVAKQSKNIEYQTEQIQPQNKSVSIFERLLSCRICDIISCEFNKILNRHIDLRKKISQVIDNNKELRQALEYYDHELLKIWHQKQIKIRLINQQDVFLPISSLQSVKFPEPLTKHKTEQVSIGTILMEYLRKLATVDMELQKKKIRYRLVINFLQLVHNFQLEVTIFFNSNYEVDFSLQKLVDYIKDGNINEQDEKDYHKGLNHITIALQCREKDERFREVADNLKLNCEKRIDDIQREINGY